jgi:hypothetical protein
MWASNGRTSARNPCVKRREARCQLPYEHTHAMVVFHHCQRRPLMVILLLWMHISWRNGGLKMVTIDRYMVTIRPDKRQGTCVVLIWSLLDQ